MNQLHQHSIETPNKQNFDLLGVYEWDFNYTDYDFKTHRLGESFFMGTVDEAHKEAHARAIRHEASYDPIYEITLVLKK